MSVEEKRRFDVAKNPLCRATAKWPTLILGSRTPAQEFPFQVFRRPLAGRSPLYRRALAINPDYAEAHNNLGAIYEQQGRLEEAA